MQTRADSPAPEPETAPAVVSVRLPIPLDAAYDYRLPDGMTAPDGAWVRVPLGRTEQLGVVWGEAEGGVPPEKLRDVVEVLDLPPLPEPSRRFVEWVAGYTLAPLGSVLRMAMSVPGAFRPGPTTTILRAAGPSLEALGVKATQARLRLLDVAARAPAPPAALARAAGVSAGVAKALLEAGALVAEQVERDNEPPLPDPAHPGPGLSPSQERAARALREALGFSVTLLEGVTGAGKTEVYFEAIAETLARGGQVLVMLPEIALTAQWLARFQRRFGAAPVPWHSDLPGVARRAIWRSVLFGQARVVVGARSALFLPYRDLGLIVVDEEHDGAFKQEDGVAYQARDMAVVRARLSEAPIVLVSATPSLETRINVAQGRYRKLHLPTRHGGASLPRVGLVDLRKHPPVKGPWGQSFLSPPLAAALTETLEAGEQALLYLNRRGYAPLTLCRTCGHRLQCPSCTAWLVEHRLTGRLQCHHCGHAQPLPRHCPECDAEDSLVPCGPGVERLAEEVAARHPAARMAVAASDTLTGPGAVSALIEGLTRHEIDVVIGTQLLAKGHHFPLLTLVGVVDGDLGLGGGDLRAAERTFQLLSQVAGRAGRAQRPGRVLVQTHDPEHPVMAALAEGDAEAFLEGEAMDREASGMPPFGRLAALIVSAPTAREADALAQDLARVAPLAQGVRILGPAPAPLAVLRGRHRRRLLVTAPKTFRLQAYLRDWLGPIKPRGAARIQVDIDPYSFM